MTKVTIVIPCFNEEKTLETCVKRVLEIADETLALELIIVDDASKDQSLYIAKNLEIRYPEIVVLHHEKNQGKGAALRTGFQKATGDFVAAQDADLEYDPMDLRRLLIPLINNQADVVLGSRFLSAGAHRVLYFWHSLGNRFLTFVSNMFTDLNLTDMETCYKVFRRDVIQSIDIQENRFGFEPEIIAKVAHKRLRIYEMGVSYHGRTYQEGKKIGVKDGFRAIYCILRYNAHKAPVPVQFLLYLLIGGLAAIINVLLFMMLFALGASVTFAAPAAFFSAAIVNYLLCIMLLFRHKARWNPTVEIAVYWFVVSLVSLLDLGTTRFLLSLNFTPGMSKILASVIGLAFNFMGRRFFVFPEPSSGPWKPQGGLKD